MDVTDDPPFVIFAAAAFPWSCRPAALGAARALSPIVNHEYRRSSVHAVIGGQSILIPKRIHFSGDIAAVALQYPLLLPATCLQTRSTDGYLRQCSLLKILTSDKPWAIPFIVLLAGEYVIEIVEDIARVMPALNTASYANFVRENRTLMRFLRQKAASYWNCYYRDVYSDRRIYPGLVFLHELEQWAA